jgi:transketolase
MDRELVAKAVKTIQMLSVDGVQKANSGHPGAPMGLASIAVELWLSHLRYDPSEPAWPNRDRFVLSCGHASMLLYSLLHVSGYDLPMEQLQNFRQLGSITPGHPEIHVTPGVETTTGPLGQGIANAVGMAASIKMMAARLGEQSDLMTGRVFGIASDGDIMEGVSSEASSLAGHLGLDNLVFFYDDNSITIDGATDMSFSEDVGKRYEAYGWFVQHIDGHDHDAIRGALDRAVAEEKRPSLIVAKTHIGFGSPNKQDSEKAHGSPLGADEITATKNNIGWPLEPSFLVPDEVRALFAEGAGKGKQLREAWQQRRQAFLATGSDEAKLFEALMERRQPADLLQELLATAPEKSSATRNLSGAIQQRVAALVPSLVGGSADLTPSNKTYIKGSGAVSRSDMRGRNLHFGVREHGMGAFVNGMAQADGFIPYCSTFLVFSDYMRPAMRLAALSHLQSLFIFTHDSVYLGEDGPTHQPVEHFWALRTIPNLDLFRPADASECCAAWAHAMGRTDGPTAFALTRQGVPVLERPTDFDSSQMLRGAYVLNDADGPLKAVVVATGSEVHVAVAAKALLGEQGKGLRVVSAPCWDAFERQDAAYRATVLPAGIPRCTFEVGITLPWRAVAGEDGLCIGHDGFGMSAPAGEIQKAIGHDPESVAARIAAWLS